MRERPGCGYATCLFTASSSISWIIVWYGLLCFAARRRNCCSSRGEIRMAMRSLACPVRGRPTRRARFSSSPVISGMSVRSSSLSGKYFALVPRGLTRADDADRFCAIFSISEAYRSPTEGDAGWRIPVASSVAPMRPNAPGLPLRARSDRRKLSPLLQTKLHAAHSSSGTWRHPGRTY
jgi:hypothetical protein